MTTTIAEHAVNGLDVAAANGIVRVRDGADTWLCRESRWDAAIATLTDDASDDDEGGSDAYTALCAAVGGPIATVIGVCRGDWGSLVRDAVGAGLLDEEDAERMYGMWHGAHTEQISK